MKWAWSAPGEWRREAADLSPDGPAALCERSWSAAAPPQHVVLSSVLDETRTQQLIAWIRRRWSLVPHRVRAQAAQLGVTSRYRDPGSLGSDRWAALIGAHHIHGGPLSVVDGGSAVTVDALSADGEFLGGVIFPGLAMSRRALAVGTAGVHATGGEADSCFARATGDAVAAGTLFGLAGAIERVCEEQRRRLGPNTRTLLTGGDAVILAAHLRLQIIHDPDLVLRGLDLIATAPA